MGIEKDLDELFSYDTVRFAAPPACAAAPARALLWAGLPEEEQAGLCCHC
jgi:hypothetical protein